MITILTDKAANDLGQDMYKKIANVRQDLRFFCMDDMNVEPCYACRGCEEKTYGRCVIRDDADLILPCLVRSQAIIIFTTIVFGSYSFSIKRIADRFMLLLEKGYKCRNGELAFGKYPGIDYYVIGAFSGAESDAESDKEEIQAFRLLVTECHKITGWVGKPIVLPTDMDEYNCLMLKVLKP